MKKNLLALSIFAFGCAFSQLNAQVIFSEDFDGIAGPTAGGAGTYVFPAGWLLANVDNRTPDPSVAYVNEAWERREDFGLSVVDSVAFSTSYYSPVGQADDWMWTPPIAVTSNCVLTWNARAYDSMYPDGYEVRIMVAPTVPTGGTGVLGNMVSASAVLFSTPAESSSWVAHSLNLAAYAGQTVRIAFRNNSNDQFLLVVDDVQVAVQVNDDAGLVTTDTAQYTIEPTTQRTADNIHAVVHNYGSNTLSNVQVKLNIYNSSNSLVNTVTSPSLATLVSGASSTISCGSVTPPATPDTYTYEYVVLHSGSDQVASNDTLRRYVLIDQNTYARDDGTVTGSLGIGSGNGGYLGEQFQVVNNGKIDSVMVYVTRGYTGKKYACVIWNMSAGIPNAIVASTDTLLYPDDSARVYTLPIHGGPYVAAPAMYAVTMVEFDSTLALGLTNTIFHNGTTWVNWPTNPLGNWASNEAFGSSYAKSYVIRPHFEDICFGVSAQATSVTATCGSCTDGSATATSVNGVAPFTYSWSPSGGTGATANGLTPGTYVVTVTDANGCPSTTTVSVGNSCTSFTASVSSTTPASCGTCADGDATVTPTNGVGPYAYSWTPAGGNAATASGLLPGSYTVTVMDASGCSAQATVTVTFSTGLSTNAASGTLALYPNPSSGSFSLELNLISASGVDIEVLNELGERVIFEHHDAYAGEILPFFIGTPGAYTVKIHSADGVNVIPVMINN